MNDTYNSGNTDSQKYQQYQQFPQGQPRKTMSPRKKKIIIAVIAVLVIQGCIPFPYGTKGESVWGMEAFLWETMSYHVPVVSDDFVGYNDGSYLRVLIFSYSNRNNYADETARDKIDTTSSDKVYINGQLIGE